MIHLILGGARSGKSSFALQEAELLINEQRLNPVFIATATASDDEMTARIERHKNERGEHWQLREVPLDLVGELNKASAQDLLLIDCLTLWLNNQLYLRPDDDPALATQQITDALNGCQATVLLIANEVGLGVIPMGEVSRIFVDQAGWLNQAIGRIADRVTFVAAGLPLNLKSTQSLKDKKSLKGKQS